jgi:hypothetical protein
MIPKRLDKGGLLACQTVHLSSPDNGWTAGHLSSLGRQIDPHQQVAGVVAYSLQLPAFHLLAQGVRRGAEQARSFGERHADRFGHGWTLARLDKVGSILARDAAGGQIKR